MNKNTYTYPNYPTHIELVSITKSTYAHIGHTRLRYHVTAQCKMSRLTTFKLGPNAAFLRYFIDVDFSLKSRINVLVHAKGYL